MKTIIQFINNSEYPNLIAPVPASEILPDWYKKLQPYVHESYKEMVEKNGGTRATMKKCMPVFDMLTSGYLYLLPIDLEIKQVNNMPYFTWPLLKPISFHHYNQVVGHPQIKPEENPAKVEGHWAYKTPKGYSCLFMPPSHRENIIQILPGIVDTDTYNYPVHFPFVMSDPTFEGIIPRGTPIAQIIPFKRESWNHKITKEDKNETDKIWYNLKSVFAGAYKNTYWNRKEYK